ncbi:MAG: YceG-like family, partial [Actinomycetota bacterium]
MDRVATGDLEVLGATRTRHELLTIASLIERETQVDGERALVSGVIHGRLQDGMRL